VPAEVSRFSEAPLLAEQVEAGALPPVEERLPVDPMIVPVVEEIGQYGGIWHRVIVGANDCQINRRLTYECPFRWTPDGGGVVPNWVKAYDLNEDASEFTLYLREGMKWSDGEPFTAEDLVFWYEDVLQDEDLSPTFPKWLRDPTTDEPAVLEKVDDYAFKLTFANSYGLFGQILASPDTREVCRYPKHYLSQFHPNYVAMEDLQPKIEEAGFDNWWELFGDRRGMFNPEMPEIWAWLPKRVPPDVPVVCERNPYFYKVDPEGQQLPYVDAIQSEVVENSEILNMKAASGEIDMQFRHVTWTNYPIFIENAEKGDYRVLKWTLAEGSNATIRLNHTHKDPVVRQLIQTRDFRIALSLGIDRVEINELAYQGFGTPRQASLIPQCPYYKEEHGQRYAEHDPDQANAILDDIGLVERDDEGFRLRPDGEPLIFTLEYAPIFGPWRDAAQMVSMQWQAIGVRAVPKEEDRSLLDQRANANEHDVNIWMTDYCFTPLINPVSLIPISTWNSFAPEYAAWYVSGGESGEEPTEEFARAYALYDQIKAASPDKVGPLAEALFDHVSENVWTIGTVGGLPHVGVVKNNFRNVPEEAVSDWLQLTPGNTNPEQYFWKQE